MVICRLRPIRSFLVFKRRRMSEEDRLQYALARQLCKLKSRPTTTRPTS